MHQPTSVVAASWPNHLIPMCMDGGSIAKLPFPHVLDVAHLVDFCALHYYPAPTVIPGAPQPAPPSAFANAVERRASVAPGAQGPLSRKRSMVGFSEGSTSSPTTSLRLRSGSDAGADDRETDTDFISCAMTLRGDQAASPSPTRSNARRRSSAAQPQPAADKYEVQMQPAGTLLLVGGAFKEPRHGGAENGNAQRSFADEEKYYVLSIPNLRVFLQPQSAEQHTMLRQHLPQWIRVANKQMFNSRMLLVRAEFSAVPIGRPLQPNVAADDAARRIYQQQCLHDDLEFCRHLSSAIFAFGSFTNAREATNDKGVPERVVQKYVTLSSSSSSKGDALIDTTSASPSRRAVASHALDIAAMGKKFATVVVPFAFGTQDRLAVSVKHEALGWYVPAHHRSSASLMQLFASHDLSKQPLVVELAPKHASLQQEGAAPRRQGSSSKGGSIREAVNSRIRVLCKFSWVADENYVLRVALKASNLLRRDFFLTDPVCFVSAKPMAKDPTTEEGANSVDPAPAPSSYSYKYVTEAYRNKLEAQFCPLMFALPMDIPKAVQSGNVADFVAESAAVAEAPRHGVARSNAQKAGPLLFQVQPQQLQSTIFPPYVLPPIAAPLQTVADIRTDQETLMNSVFTGHRFGDDILLPYVNPEETLTIEVVDAAYDPSVRDTLPSLVGSAQVSVRELLDKAETSESAVAAGGTAKVQSATEIARLSLITPGGANGGGAVTITASMPASTVDRIRSKQKKRYPITPSRFVFHSIAEATSAENSHMLLRAARGPELFLGGVTKQLRPSFLSFFQGGQWDLSSIIVVDATPSALWAYYNSFLPNDMPTTDGGGATTSASASVKTGPKPQNQAHQNGGANKGKNIFETMIVAINRLLVPILTRGGSDLYIANRGQDGTVSLVGVHNYPDGFGVHVDETTLSAKQTVANEVFSPALRSGNDAQRTPWEAPLAQTDGSGAASHTTGLPTQLEPELLESAEHNVAAADNAQSRKHTRQAQIFSVIRDWGGEGTLRPLKERIETVVLRTRSMAGMSNPDDYLERALAEIQTSDSGGSPRKVQTSKALVSPPPPHLVPRLPMHLGPILKRLMARCVALTKQRHATVARAKQMEEETQSPLPVGAVPANCFHVLTIMIHSEVEDINESIGLLLSWLSRPVLFILMFLDDAASSQFSGIPNCVTMDLSCCSRAQQNEQRNAFQAGGPAADIKSHESSAGGSTSKKSVVTSQATVGSGCHCLTNYEVPLVSVHKQLSALESVVQRIPLAFLSFARLCGIEPEPVAAMALPSLASPPFNRSALSTTKSALAPSSSQQAISETTSMRSTSAEQQPDAQPSGIASRKPNPAQVAQKIQDERMRQQLQVQSAHEAELQQFADARTKFLYAFGFKKRPVPPKHTAKTAQQLGKTPPPSILHSTSAPPPTVGQSNAPSPVKPTFAEEPERRVSIGAKRQSEEPGGALTVVPNPPPSMSTDFRGANVSIVDVYMNDEQIREWETDPQRIRAKLQAFRAATPGAAAASTESVSSPLVDDSLIRLHLQRLRSTSANGDSDNGSNDDADEDVDFDQSVASEPLDPQEAVQLLSRRTRQDGHWKQSNIRINGMEVFANKLPQPPSNRKGSGAGGRRRTSGAHRDEDKAASDDEKESEALSARQMAQRRERLETEKSVERALKTVLGNRAKQHLQKPQLHSRILSDNAQIEKRRKSSLMSTIPSDEMNDDSNAGRRESTVSLMKGASICPITGTPETILPDSARFFSEYLKRSQTILLTGRLKERMMGSTSRPTTAGTSRSSSRSSVNAPSRPDSAPGRGRGASSAQLRGAAGKSGGNPAEDEDESNIRFQQLAFDKKAKLQQLLAAEQRSFGGPRLQEELILEQEAELERRRFKDARRRETERIEEAYRSQRAAEQLEKNRSKLRQMLLSSSSAEHQEDEGETNNS